MYCVIAIAITHGIITMKIVFISVLLKLGSRLSEDLAKIPFTILIHMTGMRSKIQHA